MEIDKGLKSTSVTDNGPKLTTATKLNASVSADSRTEPPAVAGALKEAANNNSDAAADIVKLTSDREASDVAKQNLIASRINPDQVDKFAAELKNKILEPAALDSALGAHKNISATVVGLLLS
jgi:hypothetical protein